MNRGGDNGGGAAPTGCYKCGRPGHWSRDCPSNPSGNPNSSSSYSKATSSSFKSRGGFDASTPVQKATEKPKKVPRVRPKLTPELLLSNDGLGYVLRHFPRAFKYRGRGHEVSDLGNLIGLYAEWHSRLLPYFPFDQFVHKVEQVGTTKRVRTCIRELREKVANGGDPSKLHEPSVEHDVSNSEQDAMNVEEEGAVLKDNNTDTLPQEMLQEIYKQASEEPSVVMRDDIVAAGPSDHSSMKESSSQVPDNAANSSSKIHISEEQRARMEANRLKALERATARACSSQAV